MYATDTLILLIFILWIFNRRKFLIKPQFPIVIFALCLIIGIALSKSPQVGIYGAIKILEFSFVGFYVAQDTNKLKFANILLMFSIGIVFESFLAFAQYINHGSLQGIFYFFGERLFNSNTPGIANASLGGELFLRPYGTFSHPNVLAGHLIIAMTLIVASIKYKVLSMKEIFLKLSVIIGTASLLLTLSRIAIVLWFVILGIYIFRRFVNLKSYIIILSLGLILVLGLTTPLGTRFASLKLTDESIVQRESLIKSSIAMIRDNLVFGVGLNNFLINLPDYQKAHTPLFYLQPVHNIFLLIFSETGIIGFSFFFWFLVQTYRRINSSFIIYPLSLIIILGLFDHYFLTLQQGQLLLTFILGLCWYNKPLK